MIESFVAGFICFFIGSFIYEKCKWQILKIWYNKKGKQRISIQLQTNRFMNYFIEHNKKNYDIKHKDYYLFTKYHYKAILIEKI